MRKDAYSAVAAIVVLTVLLGIAYPLTVTAVGQLAFHERANGSLVTADGRTVGSRLIGQDFRRPATSSDAAPRTDADGTPVLVADPRYFQPRPSVSGYAADATTFSNHGPSSIITRDAIVRWLHEYLTRERAYLPDLTAADVPVDAVTDSGSNVDPHISPANAQIQAHRVAAIRRLPLSRVLELVATHTQGRDLGLLGEPRVTVLPLNLALDREPAVADPAESEVSR